LLDGRVRLRQPQTGYRAAIDPIFLAAVVPAREDERLLELGCGVAAAALCLLDRMERQGAAGVTVTGLEIQGSLADLARLNAAANGREKDFRILRGDIKAPPPVLAPVSFDGVFFNPPYHPVETSRASSDPARATANQETAGTLEDWLAAALKLLKPKGHLTLIHRADRLAPHPHPPGRPAGGNPGRPAGAGRGDRHSAAASEARQPSKADPGLCAETQPRPDAAFAGDGGAPRRWLLQRRRAGRSACRRRDLAAAGIRPALAGYPLLQLQFERNADDVLSPAKPPTHHRALAVANGAGEFGSGAARSVGRDLAGQGQDFEPRTDYAHDALSAVEMGIVQTTDAGPNDRPDKTEIQASGLHALRQVLVGLQSDHAKPPQAAFVHTGLGAHRGGAPLKWVRG
jgi:SAM-dependent methyltransferase